MRGTPKTTEGIAMPGYVTYLDTVTRHGAPLTVRSYENGRGAQVFVRGECIGSIDNPAFSLGGRGFMRRCFGRTANPALPSLDDAVAFIARECGSPDARHA
jgi:hypothetical protein